MFFWFTSWSQRFCFLLRRNCDHTRTHQEGLQALSQKWRQEMEDRYCFGEHSLELLARTKATHEAAGSTCTVTTEIVGGRHKLYTLTVVPPAHLSRKERGL